MVLTDNGRNYYAYKEICIYALLSTVRQASNDRSSMCNLITYNSLGAN